MMNLFSPTQLLNKHLQLAFFYKYGFESKMVLFAIVIKTVMQLHFLINMVINLIYFIFTFIVL